MINPDEMTKSQKAAARIHLRGKLIALRKTADCSQQEIADLLGIKHSYAALLESSRKSFDINKADSLVRRAYAALGLDFDAPTVSDAQQLNFNFAKRVSSAPAEVEAEVLTRLTPQEVSRRINEFAQEFTLLPEDLAKMFGVSRGHEYVLRAGRMPSGIKMRRKVIQVINKTAARWRQEAAATTEPTEPTHQAATVPSTPQPTASLPPETVTPQVIKATDTVIPAVLVKDEASLISALSFDFTTRHRLQRLPGGAILVSKEM